ncbi:MAG TPA: hypothetical protein VKH42_12880 [Vicinamibacterales bacterium]|nr:hypothetical protein [Vicinamibacterales bacterium]
MPDVSNRRSADQTRENSARQERSNERTAQADASPRQSVEATARSIKDASRDRTNGAQSEAPRWQRNAQSFADANPALRSVDFTARQDLSARIDAFVAQQTAHVEESEKRAVAATDLITGAAAKLENQQRDALRAASATERPGLEAHHAEQWKELNALASSVKSELADARERDTERLRSQRDAVATALTRDASPTITEQLRQVDLAAQREQEKKVGWQKLSQHTDMDALKHAVGRLTRDIVAKVSPEESRQWRAALGDAAKTLDDAAITRVKNAAQNPGDAINAVKGQLFEEIMAASREVARMVADAQQELDRRGIQATAHFIAGDRVRDASGYQKVSDGLIGWRDQNDRIHVMQFLEAKSGQDFAATLQERAITQTKRDQKEWGKYAADVLRENGSEARVLQTEDGQLGKTRERLDEPNRLYIDGRRTEMALDDMRAPKAAAFVPGNVTLTNEQGKDVTRQLATQLRITDEEIVAAATRAVAVREELERRRAEDARAGREAGV